ncbi:hypothetical protein AAFC00_002648 [Neodothiora populina]|uniref:Ribosomal protein L34 n=1 Tax=Neodothiora populina TaxID=2781224 RepID=A0ABR3P7S1_9PEZI
MFCLRCTKRIAAPTTTSLLQSAIRSPHSSNITTSRLAAATGRASAGSAATSFPAAQRTFASFSNPTSTFRTTTRPQLPSTTSTNLSLSTTLEAPSAASALLPQTSSSVTPPGGLLQSRGPKRDTFDPSHRVRKRRHGFLARLKSRTGRNLLKRRRLKRRSTLSH